MNFSTKKHNRAAALVIAAAMMFTCFVFTDGAYAASKKSPYEKGSNIKNAVFYIAVDADGNGKITDDADAVYYYTYNEIINAGEEVAFHYGNHGQGETANVKGAKLSTLLDNLEGVDIQKDWIIQYMEEDAYHASYAEYQDTVQGLTDENGVGNGSGSAMAVETMIGYANKTVFDAPDANNVSDTEYVDFLDYSREPSYVRAYRQTASANSSVLKLLKGVVVSNNVRQDDAALPSGKNGYILKSVNSQGTAIADDYTVQGLLEGMKWSVTPNVNVPWATLNSSQSGSWNGTSKLITVDNKLTEGKKAKPTAEVAFTFTEQPFFTVYHNDKVTQLLRSNLAGEGYEYPTSNVKDGTSYEYFGYNKPMYVRYQGVYLDNLIDVNTGDKVYIVRGDGSTLDITDRVDDFFVAYYYTQSKSSSNISNGKRVPLNYESAVFVDTKSAAIEYSNDISDYKVESGKEADIITGAEIAVVSRPEAVSGVTASLSKYNSIKVKWDAAADAAGYKVYYRTGNGSWKTKSVTGTSTTLSGLSKCKTYSVKVRAYNKAGDVAEYGAYSAVKSATTLKQVSISVSKTSNKAKVKVSNIAGESGYQIYYKTGNGQWKLAKTLKANSTTYTMSKKMIKGKTYYFKARAYKTADGNKVYAPWSSVKKIKR